MDVFVARQPIFDTQLKTFGYELLFRNSLNNFFPDIDGDTASSTVLSNSFFCIGLEKLTSGKKAFVNFTRDLLLKKIPGLFPLTSLYAEILETIEPDVELISVISQMCQKGCHFALDDFIFHEKFEPFINYADIIKIDIQQTSLDEVKFLIDKLEGKPIKYLAEKVETREEYSQAIDAGFSYFQGYFFSKPEILTQKSIAPSQVHLLRIIGELNREETDINRLENIVKADVSISYRLLQYMNSAYFNLPNKVVSIKGAILFLGLIEVRKIVSLFAMTKLFESKPNELLRTSVIRAKLCEIVGKANGYHGDPSELFLLGLFSLMDVILCTKIESVVDQLPLSEQLKTALISGEGELGKILAMVCNYEKGNWDDNLMSKKELIDNNLKIENYIEAITWTDSLIN